MPEDPVQSTLLRDPIRTNRLQEGPTSGSVQYVEGTTGSKGSITGPLRSVSSVFVTSSQIKAEPTSVSSVTSQDTQVLTDSSVSTTQQGLAKNTGGISQFFTNSPVTRDASTGHLETTVPVFVKSSQIDPESKTESAVRTQLDVESTTGSSVSIAEGVEHSVAVTTSQEAAGRTQDPEGATSFPAIEDPIQSSGAITFSSSQVEAESTSVFSVPTEDAETIQSTTTTAAEAAATEEETATATVADAAETTTTTKTKTTKTIAAAAEDETTTITAEDAETAAAAADAADAAETTTTTTTTITIAEDAETAAAATGEETATAAEAAETTTTTTTTTTTIAAAAEDERTKTKTAEGAETAAAAEVEKAKTTTTAEVGVTVDTTTKSSTRGTARTPTLTTPAITPDRRTPSEAGTVTTNVEATGALAATSGVIVGPTAYQTTLQDLVKSDATQAKLTSEAQVTDG